MIGLDMKNGDFQVDTSGNAVFMNGKNVSYRNFGKILRTAAGELSQSNDSRERYNPQVGLDYSRIYSKVNSITEATVNVQQEVERLCRRFINAQKVNLEYMGEDEVISRYVVVATALDSRVIQFNVLLWTVADIRNGKSPSFNQTFTTT